MPKRPDSVTAELAMIARLRGQLAELDYNAQARVLGFLLSRFQDDVRLKREQEMEQAHRAEQVPERPPLAAVPPQTEAPAEEVEAEASVGDPPGDEEF